MKLFYVCVFFLGLVRVEGHKHRGKCGFKHNLVPELGVSEPLPPHIKNDPKRRRLASSSHPFKVHVDTSNVRGVSDTLREYLVDLVANEGNRIFANKIGVHSEQYIQGSPSIRRYCSYDSIVSVPSSYDSGGVEGDFLLFLATDDTGNDGTLAYATACYLDQSDSRPVVGFAVFNPYYLDPAAGKLDNDVATYVHEVLHALVFSSQLWKFFPKTNGLSQYYVEDGNHYLRGPNLLQTVRSHFNCSSVRGVPLEDDGGDGSKGGHFERIVFGDETMVSEDVSIAKFSKMTLALMKDSGWYDIDIEMGDHYTWGKGEGCELFKRTCALNNVEESCNDNNNFGCDKTFKYKMQCRQTTFTGGCNIKTKGSTCLKDHENKYFFETAGHNTRCQEFYYKGQKMAGCMEIQCAEDNKSYQVTIKGNDPTRYTCHKENEVFILGSNFKFMCENPRLICGDLCPKSCHHRGKCLENGLCACEPFFSGDICGTFDGCGSLSSSLCSSVVQSNRLDTADYGNSYTSDDYDKDYLSHSSWTDVDANGNTVATDTGTSSSYRPSSSGGSSGGNPAISTIAGVIDAFRKHEELVTIGAVLVCFGMFWL